MQQNCQVGQERRIAGAGPTQPATPADSDDAKRKLMRSALKTFLQILAAECSRECGSVVVQVGGEHDEQLRRIAEFIREHKESDRERRTA
jgi:hypothetical protein